MAISQAFIEIWTGSKLKITSAEVKKSLILMNLPQQAAENKIQDKF